MAIKRICSIDECSKPHYCRSFCRGHYRKFLRMGDATIGLTEAGEPSRYLKDVVMTYDGDECLSWPFARSKGYASIGRANGNSGLVHRIVCESVHGSPVGDRKYAAHSCGNGHLGCVNPKHLRWATHAENMLDRNIHGTSNRGQRSWMSRLTNKDIIEIRKMAKSGFSQSYIAKNFGVARSTISSVLNGYSWSWL